MQTLVTPAAVVELAFTDGEIFTDAAIPESAIAAAQERYVRPVVGDALYERLLEGGHADFTQEYLAAPLALYVRCLLAPQSDIRHGPYGTVQPRSDTFAAPSAETLRRSRDALLQRARQLMRSASDHLESHAEEYPAYDPQSNILNRCSIDGKLVQIR